MPFPLLAGIPWLAGLVATLFSSLFAWFMQFMTKRLAILLAVATTIGVIIATFFAIITSIVNSLKLAMPQYLVDGAGLVIPDNAMECATLYCSAWVARYAYDWNIKIIQYKLF